MRELTDADGVAILSWARSATGRRMTSLVAAVGLLLCVPVALATARIQSPGATRLLGGWADATGAAASWLPAVRDLHWPLVGAVVGLAVCWVLVAVLASAQGLGTRRMGAWAGAWSLSFVMVPPVLSRDAYAYLAHGEVLRRGLDPYRSAIAVLGPHSAVLAATDPVWRHALPPYGGLALRLSWLAAWAGGGHPVLGIVVLKAIAALSVAATAWVAVALVAPGSRGLTVWLVAASPLVLLHAVGGAHWEALAAALAAASLLALHRGRPYLALAVAVLSTGLKVTTAVLVGALLLVVWRRRGLRVAVAAGVGCLLAAVLLPLALGVDPLGFRRGLTSAAAVWNPLTPSTTLAIAVRETLDLVDAGGVPHLLLGLQVGSVALGGVLGLVLVLTSGRRDAAGTAGLLLADVAVLGPVLWPWYLVPAVVCLYLSDDARCRRVGVALAAGTVMFTLPVGLVRMQRLALAGEVVALGLLLLVNRYFPAGVAGRDSPRVEVHALPPPS